jgi:hypothetical protein
MIRAAGIMLKFPSPLWGGIKGGGRSGVDSPFELRLPDTSLPPPLTPPHKGEGKEKYNSEHIVFLSAR